MQHDSSVITAQDICDALNREGFGATLEHDAALEIFSPSSFVTSILAPESSGNDSPSTEILTDFLQSLDTKQVETFHVDVHSKTITVIHNPLVISAETIVLSLYEKIGFQARVAVDGADHQIWEFPDEVEPEEAITEQTAHLKPTVILSGLFWIISMLSFIGGNWYVLIVSFTF